MTFYNELMEFKPLGLEDRKLISDWLERFPPETSELTFTNLYCWQDIRRVSVHAGEQALLLLAESGGRRFFLPPLCLCDPAGQVRRMFDHALEQGFEPVVERVPEEMATELAAAGFRVQEDRDSWDYVYAVSDLALLEGRKYDGKRNFVKQVLARHRCVYRRITPDIVEQCLALETSWCDLRHCDADPGLAAEQKGIAVCLENWDRFPLMGGAVFVDDRLAAFTVGEKLSPVTAVVHFEKADPRVKGLYQLINQWFCEHELLEYRFVNREQDLGLEGLRKAKESYHPHHMVRKSAVRPGKS